ncbi:CDP-diacylglycerol-glycerol-3-phosphate 3-phosphatidyltransferase [Kalaharituber pfeilii]|nr:CDP-diacylglycerol-glycerol-3-phosphate 3-phosphatidyltransferase [Kalaharituber pfeilii]
MTSLTTELDKLAPRFDIDGRQIEIINAPSDFYSVLKEKIRNSRQRIFLSTLYVGASEHELIDTLRHALHSQPSLKLSVLCDALRGTRESPRASCASLLAPLVQEFGEDRVQIRMYHTPNLTGWKKRFIPVRMNEGWGLQHMKLYGFDDEIILSGANLSTDYFTNRQDRYHVFSNKQITDYFFNVQQMISSLSYQVLPDSESDQGYRLIWPAENSAPEPIKRTSEFRLCAAESVGSIIRPPLHSEKIITPSSTDTVVYPLGQFTPLFPSVDLSTEMVGLCSVMKLLARPDFSNSMWTLTAGYFNIHPTLKKLLLASQSSRGTVITAHQHANGFYGSAGISGNLPPGYTLLAQRFLQDVYRAGKKDFIALKEWKRGMVGKPGGWTYHAKGIWVNPPGEMSPAITLIGSSNYTRRSYSLDIEMNALVITRNEQLRQKLQSEVENLEQYATGKYLSDFNEKVGWRVRFLVWLFGEQL